MIERNLQIMFILFVVVLFLMVFIVLPIAIIVIVGSDLFRRVKRDVDGLSGPKPDEAAAGLLGSVIGIVLGFFTYRKVR